jgi:outer membrane protein assembly factor BamD (BamD/ComL family)
MIILSTRVILHSLAKLKQIDKIREFVNEKPVLRTLPKQEADAYISYVQLSHGETEELIKEFNKKSKGYAQPVHPTILFNLAESYFREAKYDEAIKYFDQFVTHYSHLSQATQARVRLALSFELLNKPMKEVLALYRNAIDRATIAEYRYEAKLRYVGIRLNRKISPNKDDREALIFLDKTPTEEKEMHQSLNKLLWLVRLRTYINQEQYKEALTYFTTLPIDSMNLLDKRVFLGDGSEIVLGVIQQMYNAQEYTNAIKTWETYRYKFDNQIASNPYLNFIICESNLRLGLFESFTKGIEKLRKLKSEPTRNFPLWATGSKNIKIDELISELELIKAVSNGEWDKASELLGKMPETKRELLNYEYYNGLIKYHNQKFAEALSSFEEILVSQNQTNAISPTQLKELISFYTEALFKVEEPEKFQRNISAMIKDIKNSDQENLKANLERMEYLVIESYFSEKEPKNSEILKFIQGFNNQYIKSNYTDRLTLIKGISLVRQKSLQEGEEVLKALMTKQDAPGYLKELAKSEIAVLELKKKNI